MKNIDTTRALRWCVVLSPLAALVGCTSEYNLISIANPNVCDSVCRATVVGTLDNSTASAESLGYAVEVAAWGAMATFPPTIDKRNRTVAAGAPTYVNAVGALAGRVWTIPAITDSGALDVAATPWILNAPNTSIREMGYALLASDVRSGRPVPQTVNQLLTYTNVGFGEELLVGAPGSYDNIGAVVWYESGTNWQYGGELRPSGGVVGERFGAAIAAPITFDAAYPNLTTTQSPAWIAVGAPGRGSVYLFSVAPSATNPFVQLQRIDGPAGSTGFGSSLTIADFNADGLYDLAVGAPGAAAGAGRVYVFTGQSGLAPINTAAQLTVAPVNQVLPDGSVVPLSAGGEFGASLAAGYFRRSDTTRPALAVGVPGFDDGARTDSGALCQMQFTGTVPMTIAWRRCDGNPTPASNERYAHALAVGNFNPVNGVGGTTGPCATSEEVAVGIPGSVAGTTPSIIAGGQPLAGAGAVRVLGLGTEGAEPTTGGYVLFGTRVAQGLGRALASDFVQRNLYEDLLVGSPLLNASHGSFSLTRSQSPGGVGDPISGSWAATDSAGHPFSVYVLWNSAGATLSFTMLTDATITARNGGNVCNVVGKNIDFTGSYVFPTIPWTSTAVTHSERVSLSISGYNVEAVVTYNAATSRFTVDIDESVYPLSLMSPNCDIVNEPFVFNRTHANTCE